MSVLDKINGVLSEGVTRVSSKTLNDILQPFIIGKDGLRKEMKKQNIDKKIVDKIDNHLKAINDILLTMEGEK